MKMTPNELRDAIEYTAQNQNFSAKLVEKDYYCSLILKFLYNQEFFKSSLIFKGGTLLAKSYLDFFRLSEDLDFAVANDHCLDRPKRKKFADEIRKHIEVLLKELNLQEVSPLKGFNESHQYNAIFSYNSVIGLSETIKFEIGLRGDLICNTTQAQLKTLLENPFNKKSIIEPFDLPHVIRTHC